MLTRTFISVKIVRRKLTYYTGLTTFSRDFSWKSRLNRDPELRQRKLESLNKRYILRRFDKLDFDEQSQSSVIFSHVQDSISSTLSKADVRLSKLTNIFSFEQSQLEGLLVGKTYLHQLAHVTLPSSRSATIVVPDRGNIERVMKAVKIAFPYCQSSIIDRERISLKIARVSPEVREDRGKLVQKHINEVKKDLKKLEYVPIHPLVATNF